MNKRIDLYRNGFTADDLTRLKLNCRQVDTFIIHNFDNLKICGDAWQSDTKKSIKTNKEFRELLSHMEKEIKRIKREL